MSMELLQRFVRVEIPRSPDRNRRDICQICHQPIGTAEPRISIGDNVFVRVSSLIDREQRWLVSQKLVLVDVFKTNGVCVGQMKVKGIRNLDNLRLYYLCLLSNKIEELDDSQKQRICEVLIQIGGSEVLSSLRVS